MLSPLRGKFVPLDPDEPMAGICQVCKTRIATIRSKTFKDTRSPANAALGLWGDMLYIECAICKERSKELIAKAGTKRQPVGTKVFVGPIRS